LRQVFIRTSVNLRMCTCPDLDLRLAWYAVTAMSGVYAKAINLLPDRISGDFIWAVSTRRARPVDYVLSAFLAANNG
jgi:hypothetical protein